MITGDPRLYTLAYRVECALAGLDCTGAALRDHADLLSAVAAADRLARACSAWYVAVDESPLPDHGMSAATAAEYEMDQAEAAYRARMAQGVGDA